MHAFITPLAPDLPSSPDILVISPDTSIGIAEVRQIQTFLSRKPLQSPHHTVIIESAHLLTLPAQSAFLKTLEEPPPGSQIYLVTSQPDLLLPTILSRCEIIISTVQSPAEGPAMQKSSDLLEKLLTSKIGARLGLVDQAKFTRESALEFLDSLEHLIHADPPRLARLYPHLATARKYLKANCNLKLTLDHFVLNLN